MYSKKNLLIMVFIFTIFLLPSTDALYELGSNTNTSEKQKIPKLESGRTNDLESDADLKGRTEENKGNFVMVN